MPWELYRALSRLEPGRRGPSKKQRGKIQQRRKPRRKR